MAVVGVLYRELLQAAIDYAILFCFRKNRSLELRFAQGFATIGGTGASISPDHGWDYQRIYEEDSCSEDE
jgi:hypothetical protein